MQKASFAIFYCINSEQTGGISWNRLNRRYRCEWAKKTPKPDKENGQRITILQLQFNAANPLLCIKYAVALAFFSSAYFHKYFVIRSFTTSWREHPHLSMHVTETEKIC